MPRVRDPHTAQAEGLRESNALAAFARSLSPSVWRATEHKAVNHGPTAPFLLTIHRLHRERARGALPSIEPTWRDDDLAHALDIALDAAGPAPLPDDQPLPSRCPTTEV